MKLLCSKLATATVTIDFMLRDVTGTDTGHKGLMPGVRVHHTGRSSPARELAATLRSREHAPLERPFMHAADFIYSKIGLTKQLKSNVGLVVEYDPATVDRFPFAASTLARAFQGLSRSG